MEHVIGRWYVSALIAVGGVACSQLAGFDDLGAGGAVAGAGEDSGGSGGNEQGEGGAGRGGTSATPRAGAPSGGTMPMAGSSGGADESGGDGGAAPMPPIAGRNGGGTAGSGGAGGGGGTNAGGMAGVAASAGLGGVGARAGCELQLLANPDFEAGPTGWREESGWTGIDGLDDVIVSRDDPRLAGARFTPPASGNDYVAWLGGAAAGDFNTVNVLQDVLIPREVTRLVLAGEIQIKTAETGSDIYDRAYAVLEDADDEWFFRRVPRGEIEWTNQAPPSGWITFEASIEEQLILDVVRGQRLTFRIEANPDADIATSFWFDSLSLVAECAR